MRLHVWNQLGEPRRRNRLRRGQHKRFHNTSLFVSIHEFPRFPGLLVFGYIKSEMRSRHGNCSSEVSCTARSRMGPSGLPSSPSP